MRCACDHFIGRAIRRDDFYAVDDFVIQGLEENWLWSIVPPWRVPEFGAKVSDDFPCWPNNISRSISPTVFAPKHTTSDMVTGRAESKLDQQ